MPSLTTTPLDRSSRGRDAVCVPVGRVQTQGDRHAVRPAPRSIRRARRDREVPRRRPAQVKTEQRAREERGARRRRFQELQLRGEPRRVRCAMRAPTRRRLREVPRIAAKRRRLFVWARAPVHALLVPFRGLGRGPVHLPETSPPSRQAWSSSSRWQTSLRVVGRAERLDRADVLGRASAARRGRSGRRTRARAALASRAACAPHGRRDRRSIRALSAEAPGDVAAARADRVEQLTLAAAAPPRRAIDLHDAEIVDRDAGGSPGYDFTGQPVLARRVARVGTAPPPHPRQHRQASSQQPREHAGDRDCRGVTRAAATPRLASSSGKAHRLALREPGLGHPLRHRRARGR